MSINSVFYEFEISKKNIEYLVEDLGFSSRSDPSFLKELDIFLSLTNMDDNTYKKMDLKNKSGLMLRFSKKLSIEKLPSPIEGLHAFIHPSSEGYLELEDFKTYLESSLNCHNIPFKRYS